MKWPTVLLPEVAGFDAPAPRNGDLPLDSEVGFLSMSGLDSDSLVVTPPEMRRAAGVAGGFTHFQNGDVLVAKITPCFENGKTAEVSTSAEHCFGSTEFHVIRANESRLLPRYLTHYLRQPWVREAGRRRMTGSAGQRRVPRSFLQELHLPLPPLDEQRRIAAILDKADALRQKRRLALQKLDPLTQSIFAEMFGKKGGTAEGWRWADFEEIATFKTGKLDSNAAVEGGVYPFFTCSKEDSSIDVYAFDCEALLLAGNNAAGEYSVKHYKGKFNAYQRTYVITLDRSVWNYEYARLVLTNKLADLKRLSKGTGTRYLTLEILHRLSFVLPPPKLQDRFADHCHRIQRVKRKLEQAYRGCDELSNALQCRAFRGEL